MARILLVEDDRWQADCYQLWLSRAHHEVRCADTAQAALDMLDTWLPQVIILDILLPHANGVQLLHQLRSYGDTQALPVIMCSSVQLPQNIDTGAYGIVAVLDKTALNPAVMREAVSHAAT